MIVGKQRFSMADAVPFLLFRGNSDNNIRQRGVVDFSYELPFGTGKSFLSRGVIGESGGRDSDLGDCQRRRQDIRTRFLPM